MMLLVNCKRDIHKKEPIWMAEWGIIIYSY